MRRPPPSRRSTTTPGTSWRRQGFTASFALLTLSTWIALSSLAAVSFKLCQLLRVDLICGLFSFVRCRLCETLQKLLNRPFSYQNVQRKKYSVDGISKWRCFVPVISQKRSNENILFRVSMLATNQHVKACPFLKTKYFFVIFKNDLAFYQPWNQENVLKAVPFLSVGSIITCV
jgi:hypothetical protein